MGECWEWLQCWGTNEEASGWLEPKKGRGAGLEMSLGGKERRVASDLHLQWILRGLMSSFSKLNSLPLRPRASQSFPMWNGTSRRSSRRVSACVPVPSLAHPRRQQIAATTFEPLEPVKDTDIQVRAVAQAEGPDPVLTS
ncbi:hypothetical protein Cadr_000011359 [Camelus dromedarius]|uniref:Uncharacterized protein n=1 Tax=Camelus dromedarius TaxID=9838 RepID=A0A5N4DUD3_CAMDR|nr:hypothetical protein Cadr_000011359 [Camelus dromedarius]